MRSTITRTFIKKQAKKGNYRYWPHVARPFVQPDGPFNALDFTQDVLSGLNVRLVLQLP